MSPSVATRNYALGWFGEWKTLRKESPNCVPAYLDRLRHDGEHACNPADRLACREALSLIARSSIQWNSPEAPQ